MRRLLHKMKGDGAAPPPRPSLQKVGLAFTGCVLVVALLSKLSDQIGTVLLIGSFGASSLLVFGYPDAPFSQPRNLVLGHIIGAIIGLTFLHLFGDNWVILALALGTTVAAMMLTHTVHPPASSTPVAVFALKSSWMFIFLPTLVGTLVILFFALIYNNVVRQERWPKHW
ncbi:MAG: HPP family protein [Verrucomicrobia bacterium]|nr:HPP family protein [Verrucomicrobiota bacterium]